MFARAVTMLAILAIAVVTTMTSAHAARMSAVPDHAVHVAEMMQAPHGGEASCDGDQHCGSADAGMCEFVCTGLSVFLPSPSGDACHRCSRVSHDRPSAEHHASRAPRLNERPPKPRLL
ncbi:hypothetical protein [Gemmobacter caeruleus]|uniref:hypothetical protein n=1 Tax=Gemmobacter caeruleus TaxID=2595004 RepID=UPI001EF0083C|nr:hypothetical protein [Gemmobacter caeruleus]